MNKLKQTYSPYSDYKDSGVAWLGDVPTGWEIKRMKFLYRDHSEKNHAKSELLSVTQSQGVVPRSWVENRMVMPSGNLESFKFIEKGDFAISLRSFEGGLEHCHHDGIISPAYTVLKAAHEKLSQKYFKFLFKSFSFISEIQTSIVGIREGKNISFEELSYSLMPLPPLPEQTAIAHFLDDKVGKIERLISIKQQQIERLKERKQILIQNAVTQGLNPNAPKKDSGIDWIGEIPAHWELTKIKYISSKVGSGITPSGGALTYLDSGIPFLRSQNILFESIDLNGVAYISERVHRSMENSQVNKNDVLLNITGGSIGRCHFIETERPMNVNQHVCIIRPNSKIESSYLNTLLASDIGQSQIWSFQQGGGREGLNFQALKNFEFPLPPKQEQVDIITNIEKQSKKINTAITIKKNQIEKLNEYKTTLINAAVTGKIKVPEAPLKEVVR